MKLKCRCWKSTYTAIVFLLSLYNTLIFHVSGTDSKACTCFLSLSKHANLKRPNKFQRHTYLRYQNSIHFLSSSKNRTPLNMGWFDNFLPKYDPETSDETRRQEYPEQYPATYTLLQPSDLPESIQDDNDCGMVRPLLKQTQLEQRSLYIAYDANKNGWNKKTFHQKVDGKGASIVLAKTEEGRYIGGYNPKGWASMGGARPSVAAFLFYSQGEDIKYQKLQKVGGGGLACAFDDPNRGLYFGPDALVIPMEDENPKWAQSKLGPYFERGPEDFSSLFWPNMGCKLEELKVFVGKYSDSEEIPYSGAVLDMTSG